MNRIALLSTLLFAAACASAPAAPRPTGLSLEDAAATITAADMIARIGFLASDELKGRDTPSPGLETAAQYLADEFAAMGLQPAGDAGSFIQRYPFEAISVDPANIRMTAVGMDGPALVYARDFFAFPAATDSVIGEAVFVGPMAVLSGDAPPAGIAGKIVVTVFDVQSGAAIVSVPRIAAEAGAAGLIYVLPPIVPAEAVAQIAEQAVDIASLGIPIPTFGVRWENAQALLRAGGADPDLLGRSIDAPVPLRTTVSLVAAPERETSQVPNVVALLPGSDPALRGETIVLSAHFDHVGVGTPNASGDSIYNGADDDASGTAVLLEVAQALAQTADRPARSVLFLAVSGEEKGLLGSLYFARNPTPGTGEIVANINMDMVGRNEPGEVVGIGREYTSLGALADSIVAAVPALGLTVIDDPNPAEQAFFRSDHVAFVKQDIPALFFTAWMHEDYHQPSDEVGKIDGDKTARIGRLVYYLTHAAADGAETVWLGDSLARVREILKNSPF